jgi:hypothetical protein
MWHLYSFISVSIFTVFCIPTRFRPYCFERNKALLSRSAELARAKVDIIVYYTVKLIFDLDMAN